MKQKSRILWLNLGIKTQVSFIEQKVQSEAFSMKRERAEDPEAINELAIAYYKKLLGQTPAPLSDDGIAKLNNLISVKISCT